MSDFDVLIDSDAFVGLFVEHDAHHPRTEAVFADFHRAYRRIVTTNFIVAETATVISRRAAQEPARRFLSFVRSGSFPIIHINEELQAAAEEIFCAQTTKDTSLFDCSNVAVIRAFHIPRIFSFDRAYKNKFNLEIVE